MACMHWLLAAGLALLAAQPALSQQGDPLKSQACSDALAALQAARERGPGAAVEPLRNAAARTCLGSAVPSRRTGRFAQPPIAVPPPVTQVDPAQRPRALDPLPPPVAIRRPAAPAQCDASGCWTSDGSHLRHVPHGQVGPPGPCWPHGGLVYCP